MLTGMREEDWATVLAVFTAIARGEVTRVARPKVSKPYIISWSPISHGVLCRRSLEQCVETLLAPPTNRVLRGLFRGSGRQQGNSASRCYVRLDRCPRPRSAAGTLSQVSRKLAAATRPAGAPFS